ncbi:MAG: glycosyltransferase family 39 protein [Myxococcales bacterium]|nr:glycosyltransferase family 39 protein [Myxococcales bacterium]
MRLSSDPAPAPAQGSPTDGGPTKGALPWRTEVMLLVVLALLLRVLKLVATEPWLDEACSIELARFGPLQLLDTLASSDQSPHPPLYFLILSGFIGLLGEGEGAVRLPSALAGVALVAGTAEAARRMAGRWPARIAGLIAAVSPLAIHYSAEARGYTLLAVLSLALALMTERYLSGGQRKHLLWMLLLGFLTSLTHYFGLLLLPLPLLLCLGKERPPLARGLRAGATLLGAMTPSLLLAGAQLGRGAGGTSWLEPISSVWGASLGSLEAMALGTQLPGYLGQAGLVKVGELSHALGIGFMGGGAILGVLWPLEPNHRGPRRALVSLVVLAAGVPLLLSLWRPLYLPGRYELAAMAPIHVLAAVGWWHVLQLLVAKQALKGRIAGLVVTLAVLGLSLSHLPTYLTLRTSQPYSFMSLTLRAGSSPKSAAIFTHLTGPPTAWQLRQFGFKGQSHYFPASLAAHPCWAERSQQTPAALRAEVRQLLDKLDGINRVFIMVSLRRGRLRPAAQALFDEIQAQKWKFRTKRSAGPLGVAIFSRFLPGEPLPKRNKRSKASKASKASKTTKLPIAAASPAKPATAANALAAP